MDTSDIQLLVLDIDGVLTDGCLGLHAGGGQSKRIAFRDIDAVTQLKRAGVSVVLMSGEAGELVEAISIRIGAHRLIAGEKDKGSRLDALCSELGVPLAATCFVGDSRHDLAAIEMAGIGACPADARAEVRAAADLVLSAAGGAGAVEEIADRILASRALAGSRSVIGGGPLSAPVVVIPARAGSKGVPGKNLREVAGRPLLAWSIGAALASTRVERVYVSTDSQAIAEVSIKYGAEVPCLRPERLAGDRVHPVEAVLHLLDHMGHEPDAVIMTLPTSPFKAGADFDRMLATLEADGACQSVVAVYADDRTRRAARVLDAHEYMRNAPINNAPIHARRQDVEALLVINGCGYAARSSDLRATRSFIHGVRARAYQMGRLSSVDLDSEEDFVIADALLRAGLAEDTLCCAS